MGRNHARTHKILLEKNDYEYYLQKFKNFELFELWDTQLFVPSFEILKNLKNDNISNSEFRTFKCDGSLYFYISYY
jgi:hypothetical protein